MYNSLIIQWFVEEIIPAEWKTGRRGNAVQINVEASDSCERTDGV